MRILFIAGSDPSDVKCGNQIRTHWLHSAVGRLGEVVVHVPEKERPLSWRQRVFRCITKVGAIGDGKVLKRRFAGEKFDAVVTRYASSAAEFAAWELGPLYLDVDDVPSEAFALECDRLPWWLRGIAWAMVRSWQRKVFGKCRGCWVTKREDAKYLPRQVRFEVLRNMAIAPERKLEQSPEKVLLTVGLMEHRPNLEGVMWFVREIWPKFLSRHPGWRYEIAGSGMPEAERAECERIEGVKTLGYVEDIDEAYARCAAAVAPVIGGAGTCVKVVEGALHGKRTFATGSAVRGLTGDEATRLGISVFEDAEQFLSAADALDDVTTCDDTIRRAGREYNSFDAFFENVRRLIVSGGTVLAVALMAVMSVGASPLSGREFKLAHARRFMLDNTLPMSGFLPGAQYSVEVKRLPAEVAFVTDKGERKFGCRIEAGDEGVPQLPFGLSILVSGRSSPAAFVRKDGEVGLLRLIRIPEDFDPRLNEYRETLKFRALEGAENPRAELSAGIGQADIRFVTEGRENRPYVENGRMFFTFSARAYGSYLGVMSIDPSEVSDIRLEGEIFFDYGDGLMRNDVACDLFHDDDGVWKAYVSNFSTGADKGAGTQGRAKGGINVAWSASCPLHGVSVMKAKSLGLDGMNEDPDGIWDAKAGKWRLLVSHFTPRGIRARMLESDRWDGGFAPIAGPVDVDSTGTAVFAGGSGERCCVFGSSDRACYVRSYPELRPLGKVEFDCPPWPLEGKPPHGRVWPAVVELAHGRMLMVTMDRENFPGMPKPNWTYGKLMVYLSEVKK